MMQPGRLTRLVAMGWTSAFLSGCLHAPGELAPPPRLVQAFEPSLPAANAATPKSSYQVVKNPPAVRSGASLQAAPVEQVRFNEPKPPEIVNPTTVAGPVLEQPPAPKAPVDPPLVTALRGVLEKQPTPGQSLAQLDPATREKVLALLALAARTSEGGLNRTAPAEADAWLTQMRQLNGNLCGRAPLVLERMCFCKKIDGFGMYEPLPLEYAFRSGSDGQLGERVQVYVEVRNFVSQLRGSTYETRLASTLEIRDFRGDLVHRMDFPGVADKSLTPRQDYFINFQFRVPVGLPAGSYTLWVTAQDANPGSTSRLARRSLDFKVAAR